MRGISIEIYRSDLGDSTNGGATSPANSRGKTFVVFDDAIKNGNYKLDECEDDRDRYVCFRVVRRNIGGREYKHLEPMNGHPKRRVVGPTFGGNYAIGDSRWRNALCDYPLPIHDRYDTPEDFAALAR